MKLPLLQHSERSGNRGICSERREEDNYSRWCKRIYPSMDELTDADWDVINSKIEEFKASNLSGGTYSGLSIVTDSGKQTIQGFSDVNFDKAYMINAKVNEMDNFWGEEAHNKLSVRFKMNVNKIYKEMVGEESVSEEVYE